jgi:hypothetical protein
MSGEITLEQNGHASSGRVRRIFAALARLSTEVDAPSDSRRVSRDWFPALAARGARAEAPRLDGSG